MGRVNEEPARPGKKWLEQFRTGGSALGSRLFSNTLLIVLIATTVTVTVLSLVIWTYYYSNLRSGLQTRADTTASFFESYVDQSYGEYYTACVKFVQNFEEKDTIELQFVNPNGRMIASSFSQWSGTMPGTPDIADAVGKQKTSYFVGSDPKTGERILAVSAPMLYRDNEAIGVLRYVTSLRYADQQVILITCFFILVGVLFILFVVFSSKFFLHSVLVPISEMTATAKRIAAGSYGSHIQKYEKDEIGELAEAINEMSDAISRTERMQTEMVSSVSHELRTPLTVITGWGETLLADPDMPREDFERGMEILLSEAKRLTGMVEELLEFTRIQDGRMTLNMQKSDLRSSLEDTIFMYASKLSQEGIELEYLENDDDIPELTCDVSRLRQVFLNVLDNAVKHGGDGKRITAEICRAGQSVAIRVRDFGPGIAAEDLPLVKQKFYRGSSKTRGNGIGLAVCDEIVRLHNGTLTLSNAEGGGALVEVLLPIDEE